MKILDSLNKSSIRLSFYLFPLVFITFPFFAFYMDLRLFNKYIAVGTLKDAGYYFLFYSIYIFFLWVANLLFYIALKNRFVPEKDDVDRTLVYSGELISISFGLAFLWAFNISFDPSTLQYGHFYFLSPTLIRNAFILWGISFLPAAFLIFKSDPGGKLFPSSLVGFSIYIALYPWLVKYGIVKICLMNIILGLLMLSTSIYWIRENMMEGLERSKKGYRKKAIDFFKKI